MKTTLCAHPSCEPLIVLDLPKLAVDLLKRGYAAEFTIKVSHYSILGLPSKKVSLSCKVWGQELLIVNRRSDQPGDVFLALTNDAELIELVRRETTSSDPCYAPNACKRRIEEGIYASLRTSWQPNVPKRANTATRHADIVPNERWALVNKP